MFETNQARKSPFSFGTTVSLVLHACLVPFALWMAQSPRVHHAVMHQLNIEIAAPPANRQLIALQRRIVNQRPNEPAPQKLEQQEPKPDLTPLKKASFDLSEVKIAPSEIHNDSPDALHLPEAVSAPAESLHASGGGPSRNGNGDFEQRAQSVGRQSTEADLINAYISAMTKVVNSHLIYPKEARKKKLEGVPWVSFVVTSSGTIKPNSLQIKKSSGYAVLDDSAMKTILSASPFQKPPRELNCSIALVFETD